MFVPEGRMRGSIVGDVDVIIRLISLSISHKLLTILQIQRKLNCDSLVKYKYQRVLKVVNSGTITYS